jgi:hypothetical protein
MQHDFENSADVAPAAAGPAAVPPPAARQTVLRSCPVPPDVLEARRNHVQYLEALDFIESLDPVLHPQGEDEAEETLT